MALKAVACALAHPNEEKCSQHVVPGQTPLLSLIPTYTMCLTHLNAGPKEEVTILVSRSTQDTLAVCLRHHTRGFSEDKLDAATELIREGLQSTDRSTRLAAG